MLRFLSDAWWALVLRGFVAVLFGVMALVWPGIGLLVLAVLFGAYALLDGAFSIAGAIGAIRRHERWWTLALIGVISLAAGVITLTWPGLTLLALFFILAARAVLIGIVEVVMAVALRKEIRGEWVLIVEGLASIAFGVLFFIWPLAGALAILWVVAAYAIIIGMLSIGLGFRVHHMAAEAARPIVAAV